ncbi:PREDICTED: putative E3 ubiquitin-protein ligase LIN-1 isoform X3 [Tarenaya hassleriana]|uniref:putative E3 ubiquitin-protein ligase LIN-1 isoform X3 n=1 Tax=Tarenaya hassleriana TaxID=28532 RepID=UPI00053C74B3|nr:PREDICTED: putative E3 ubiquitin-protein ligase LIN-1 isoform X3 [Tarenaya hassleriana]
MPHLSPSPSCSSPGILTDRENSALDSTRALVFQINDYVLRLVGDFESWVWIKGKCSKRLGIQKEKLFEFSQHSALSNLYWGVESIEAALQPEWSEEMMSRLRNSERMLQMPALLDEQETTNCVPNRILVSFSYFYLSIVSNLQGDALQTVLHFLQSVLVSPELVRTDIAPELCESLFNCEMSELQDMGKDKTDEYIREMARNYKYRATYYQVMLYGEIHRPHEERRDTRLLSHLSGKFGEEASVVTEPSTEEKQYVSETCKYQKKVHHVVFPHDDLNHDLNEIKASSKLERTLNDTASSPCLDQSLKTDENPEPGKSTRVRCLHDILKESQSDTSTTTFTETMEGTAESTQLDVLGKHLAPFSQSSREGARLISARTPQQRMHNEANKAYTTNSLYARSHSFVGNFDLSILDIQAQVSTTTWNAQMEDASSLQQLELEELLVFGHKTSRSMQSHFFAPGEDDLTFEGMRRNLHNQKRSKTVRAHSERVRMDLWENLQGMISGVLGNADEKYVSEVTMIYQMLNKKRGIKYSMLKDVILDQLLMAITSSKEKNVIKASVTILTKIVSVNRAALEDVKKRGLQLTHLASALKQNVQEAATLIYLIKPSPTEIKSLELLPALVDIACNSSTYKPRPSSPLLTPPAASLMMIEVLITAFDPATNTMHLAAISSPNVLCGLLDVAKDGNPGQFISLASILIKCMQFDGLNRKYISQHTRVAPFVHLLHSKDREAMFTALRFLHEVLRIPRSAAIKILQQLKKEGSSNIKETLLRAIQQLQGDHQLFAADILLQLNALDFSPENKMFRNEAMRALLDAMTLSEDSNMQLLSTFILANIGGTYSWTGESYTAAWLVKKGGLTSLSHRNMIRNVDWTDECLQDMGVDGWCSKMARSIIDTGKPAFHAIQEGLKSKNKRVSKACLISNAWLSIEIAKGPDSNKNSAREILLDEVAQHLHPGLELEERLLACLCIYNYSSGKGIHKLINFSEGVRESMRRLSHVTWMADELHKATDYLFSKSDQRISCVHTQILEMRQTSSGAVTALIYHKGLLYSGYSDGSIKVWDVNGKLATLLWDIKEHKSTVTCFSLFEPRESVLSGSADKTIRMWQIVKGKLECVEVITAKESVRKLEAFGNAIYLITKGHKMKLLDSSRIFHSICKGKSAKCMAVAQGKIYVGCTDSSIQELTLTNKREKEIKAPTWSWRIQNKPISSMVVYKDRLYSSSTCTESSNIKDLRRNYEPQVSITAEKGSNILAMGVVEDFIYLNRSSSANTLQIWLRRTQQKVGRLSAGSKITSFLTANDIVLCGTEAGVIKGWIPL